MAKFEIPLEFVDIKKILFWYLCYFWNTRMTKDDVREYLTKIYALPVREVRTIVKQGWINFENSNFSIAYLIWRIFKGEMIRDRIFSRNNDFIRGADLTKVKDKKPDQKFAFVTFVSLHWGDLSFKCDSAGK